ncbi:MAG: hypothetical protein HOO96_18835 [Polyangiaceae bacterium]|nr:hypothetical protein [Polyangiaceae bacterium]
MRMLRARSIAGVFALVLGACAATPEPAPIAAPATPQPPPEAANARPDLDAGAPRIPCAKTSDCACTSHYTPISAREQRGAASPGDCMNLCRSGLCFAAQGPL